MGVNWVVEIGNEFEPELDELHEDVQTEILALTRLLQKFGPQLGRPRVDTLNDSRHANMKELRFSAANGEWRAFATHGRRRRPARAAVSRIPCRILCLADVERTRQCSAGESRPRPGATVHAALEESRVSAGEMIGTPTAAASRSVPLGAVNVFNQPIAVVDDRQGSPIASPRTLSPRHTTRTSRAPTRRGPLRQAACR